MHKGDPEEYPMGDLKEGSRPQEGPQGKPQGGAPVISKEHPFAGR